jgi:hypothetical protein
MGTIRTVRAAGALVVALLIAAAAASDAAATDPPIASTVPSATPTKTAVVKSAGIALDYPRNWTVFALNKQDLIAQQKRLAKKNPALAKAFKAVGSQSITTNTKFHAADLSAVLRSQFQNNVSVSVAAGSLPGTLDDFTSAIRTQYQQVGATDVATSTVDLGGKTSYRADVTVPLKTADGSPIVGLVGQLFVPFGVGGTIVTVATGNDDAGHSLVDTMLRSVRPR